MRAVVQRRYGSADDLEVREVERPEPGDDEVLVRVRAASLHPDVWHVVAGRPYALRLMGGGFSRPKNPIPGTDMAGVVESVGTGVTAFRPGDEVCLEGRMDGLDDRGEAMDVKFDERFITMDDRFRTMELRMGQFEARITGKVDTLSEKVDALGRQVDGLGHGVDGLGGRIGRLETRFERVEEELAGLNGRVDGLGGDMRERFRVINDRLAGAA